MRRTAWLVVSPWLVVAVASAAAWVTAEILGRLLTTEDGGLGNLGGTLASVLGAGLVWCGASIALLHLVARRTFPGPDARRAVHRAVVAAVLGAVVVGAATGLLGAGGVPFVAALVPGCLPAAGTVAFLVTERRLTGRMAPAGHGRPGAVVAAALIALAGGLVGATGGVVVDVVVLGPSQDELAAAAGELVPPGYTVADPVEINGTVLLSARPQSSEPAIRDVEATVAGAGWRTEDVERSPSGGTLRVSRDDVQGSISLERVGLSSYSVTVWRAPLDGRGALAGGLLGAVVGGVLAQTTVSRRRRPGLRSRP